MREAEWLGGDRDGRVEMVSDDLNVVKVVLPRKVYIDDGSRPPYELEEMFYDVPIRKSDGKLYIDWYGRSLRPHG